MNYLKSFWNYLKQDTWHSWLVSLVLILIFIKLIFFPLLSLTTGSPLPIVVVESCSMYHETSFDSWFEKNEKFYSRFSINESDFSEFSLKSGLNKGDIVFIWGYSTPKLGDIIVFQAGSKHPLIHRVISLEPLQTKGDHNSGQLSIEKSISEEQVIGKAVGKIPSIGWIKLIFFEPFRAPEARGFCS